MAISVWSAGCAPNGPGIVGLIAKHLGEDLAQQIAPNLPPPTAVTTPVIRGGSWCRRMEAWGFPNKTGVRVQDLRAQAQLIWADIFDYGEKNCGWKPPLVG